MRNSTGSGLSLSFKRFYHVVSNGSIEHVLRNLQQVQQDFPHNEMTIEPNGHEYTFCYRVHQKGKTHRAATAWSEGRFWKAEDGHVIVEWHTQIEPLGAYFIVGLYALMACFSLPFVRDFYLLVPLIFAGLALFEIFRYYDNYKQALYDVGEAIYNTHNVPESVRREMVEEPLLKEKSKHRRAPVRETVSPDSVWYDAISEYDERAQNH